MKRFARFLLILSLITGAHFTNSLELLEHEVMEWRSRLTSHQAAQDLVLVEIDEPSLREFSTWPWPRHLYGDALKSLSAAGARRVTFDIDFSSSSTAEEDSQFADALRRSTVPVVLGIFRQAARSADGTMQVLESEPIAAFRDHVQLAAFNVRPESDGKVRRLFTRERWEGRLIPHYAALAAGQHGGSLLNYYVNFGIDVKTIPRVSFADVLKGRFDPAIFKGRDVLIGASAVQLGDMVTVPVYRSLPGAVLQALGYSSLTRGLALTRANPGISLAIAIFILMIMQVLLRERPWQILLAATAGVMGTAFIGTWVVQTQLNLYMDVMPILLGLTLDFLARMLTRLKRQDFKLLMQSMALRRRDMFMRLVVENSFDAVITVNLEGNILSYNHAAEEIFGFERDEVMDQAIAKLLPKLRQQDTEISIETLLQLRGTHEIFCGHHNGEDLILELSISQIMTEDNLVIIFLARDITAKRLAETQAREAEERLSESLESLQEGFALFDSNDQLLIANQKYREKGNIAATSKGDQPIYGDMLKPLVENGYFINAAENPDAWMTPRLAYHRDPMGVMVDQTRNGTWILTSEQRALGGGTIVIETDITALKEREADLIVARDLAESANRTKSEFIATMSHELRTPLNAIIGFSEMMTTQVFGPLGSDNYVEYAGDIQFSGKHLLSIVEGILDLAKIEAGQFNLREDKMSLNETINAAVKILSESAEKKGIKIEMDLPKKTIGIFGDSRVIRLMVLNLLSNAIKFTADNGHVALRLENADDGGVIIAIEDEGIGMSEEDMDKAFEPFGQVQSTLAREYEGTGLGLPLTKKFTELHDGRLQIDSTPGKGTCARIILPAERVVASKAKSGDGPPAAKPETGPNTATA